MTLKEHKPGTAFSGVVGRTFDTSEQAWSEPRRARESTPPYYSSSWMIQVLGNSAVTAARSEPPI
jgi:hypothetical protein